MDGSSGITEVVKDVVTTGYLARAIETGDSVAIYKACITLAAMVRRSMTRVECSRASVELILESQAASEEPI